MKNELSSQNILRAAGTYVAAFASASDHSSVLWL